MSKAEKAKPKGHARKSPSGAKRWMSCSGSLNLWRQLTKEGKLEDKRTSSKFAAEGTVAHELGEICFLNDEKPEKYLGTKREADGFTFIVSENMVDAVNVYLRYINDVIEQLEMDNEEGTIAQVEVFCDLSPLGVPGMDGGTSDFVILNHVLKTIHIIDYKHGAGVAVEIDHNPQTRSYALGALLKHNLFRGDSWAVHCTIVQPRAIHPDGPIRTEILTSHELWHWCDEELVPAGLRCDEVDAPLCAGQEQCRFCDNAPFCPEIYKATQEVAMMDFEDLPTETNSAELVKVETLTCEQKLKVMQYGDMIRAFIVSVENSIKQEMEEGSEEYNSHCKLVRGQTRRKFIDSVDDDLDSPLLEYLNEKDIFDYKLKGIGAIEKALKSADYDKGDIKGIMDEITTKAIGKIVVAPLTDKRKAIQPSAKSDFDEV